MKRLSFQDFRDKIAIQQIATMLGYYVDSRGGSTHLCMLLGERNSPQDEIVIYNPNNSSKSTYFSRKGGLKDKGNLINFVENRLNDLGSSKVGFEGVYEILNRFLGNDLDIKTVLPTAETVKTHAFDIQYWKPTQIEDSSIKYLNKQRHLSTDTIKDFASRCHIYTVGKNKHVGFPFRKPGTMEITNFEMRNFFASNNQNYKGFCQGGDKTHSSWIANFVDYKNVTDLYLFESAIDAMSFYELKGFTKETTAAFVSFGGYVSHTQMEAIVKTFPTVNYHLCFDNDLSGQCFDVVATYALHGKSCKAYTTPTADKEGKEVHIFVNDSEKSYVFPDSFKSEDYFKQSEKLEIIKSKTGKDWNEELKSYKRFDLNTNDNQCTLLAFSDFIKSLNKNGYTSLTTLLEKEQHKIVHELNSSSRYFVRQIKVVTGTCKDFTADLVLNIHNNKIEYQLSKARIVEKTTQQVIPADKILSFLKDNSLDLFNDIHRTKFEDLLKKKEVEIQTGKFCIYTSNNEYCMNTLPIKNNAVADLEP